MSVNWCRPPLDMIHMPPVHGGVSYIGSEPGWLIREVAGARIRMFAACEGDEMRDRIEASINRQFARMPSEVLEIRASPVVLQNAQFAGGLVTVDGRFLLNGASGDRVRAKFDAENSAKWRRDRLTRAFRRSRATGSKTFPLYDRDLAERLDVAIELKNGFNYFHFSTETLGSLAHFLDDPHERPIRLHLKKSPIKGFIRQFIDAVYPSLADRIKLVSNKKNYDVVRSVYSHRHYLYATSDKTVKNVLHEIGESSKWERIARNPSRAKLAAMQTFDNSLQMLRNAALAQTRARKLVATTPRLVWMGRDEGGEARARGISGHEPLLEELTALGFERVVFEHLSPLEQIATMNGADIVIAPHGAGLANMIYAKPGALVIEIGTRQTQLHRWGDFLGCAHVSRCHYDTVFTDIDGVEGLSDVPAISSGLRGVRLGRRATDCLVSMVSERLNQTSMPDPIVNSV